MTSVPKTRADDPPKGRTYTRPCQFCDTWVATVNSMSGASECCDECRLALLDFWENAGPDAELEPRFLFPLPVYEASPVSCGNRTDLPKKDRRHDWRYLGTDPRHTETGFEEMHVYACGDCGRDRQTRTPPLRLRGQAA